MKWADHILRLMNLLSLDVVLGAMAGMYFFSDLLQIDLPVSLYILLGLAVWGIYTFDHLLDARSIVVTAGSERHRFHQQHQRKLTVVLISVVVLGSTQLLIDPATQPIRVSGILLALVMVFWMGALRTIGRSASWLKEISTAMFYVAGISLAPIWYVTSLRIPTAYYHLAGGYFLLATLNLFILSYLDKSVDQKDGFGSILIILSTGRLRKLIWIIGGSLVVYLFVILLIFPSYYKIHAGILCLMTLIHLQSFLTTPQRSDYIRRKLEASFMLPLLLTLL